MREGRIVGIDMREGGIIGIDMREGGTVGIDMREGRIVGMLQSLFGGQVNLARHDQNLTNPTPSRDK